MTTERKYAPSVNNHKKYSYLFYSTAYIINILNIMNMFPYR